MPNLVDRETWLKKRLELLENEKVFTKSRDALTASRQSLPMVEITTPYVFQSEDGPKSLSDLFAGRSQLLVYHFMFGPDWQNGCPSCSFWIDNFEGTQAHLAARDTTLVLASSAPLKTLLAYRTRLGWSLPWVSGQGNSFGEDFGVSFHSAEAKNGTGYNYGKTPHSDESPGVSAFFNLGEGRVAHSYSTYGRGLDMLNGAYHLLDLTPKGRDEADLPYMQSWVRRHDEYSPEGLKPAHP